jgi:hypothetical protein
MTDKKAPNRILLPQPDICKFVNVGDIVPIKDNILVRECKFAEIHNQYIITENRYKGE